MAVVYLFISRLLPSNKSTWHNINSRMKLILPTSVSQEMTTFWFRAGNGFIRNLQVIIIVGSSRLTFLACFASFFLVVLLLVPLLAFSLHRGSRLARSGLELGAVQWSKLLLALASAISLVFESYRDPWPCLCSFQELYMFSNGATSSTIRRVDHYWPLPIYWGWLELARTHQLALSSTHSHLH
jgi:hypothetical protein